jgi:hypothetical protein
MQANVGTTDRALRILAGAALLSLLYFGEGNLKWLGLIGIVPIATGLMRFCPLYPLCGINTCGKDNSEQ